MSELQFDGLVLDYGGTICTTENRFDAPDEAIIKLLASVIEWGTYLGFASGRGSSLQRELRNAIPSPTCVILATTEEGQIWLARTSIWMTDLSKKGCGSSSAKRRRN
jgi:hydroxymethylpyrimidine pyrophosphatase-like HAD family hydrolase